MHMAINAFKGDRKEEKKWGAQSRDREMVMEKMFVIMISKSEEAGKEEKKNNRHTCIYTP